MNPLEIDKVPGQSMMTKEVRIIKAIEVVSLAREAMLA